MKQAEPVKIAKSVLRLKVIKLQSAATGIRQIGMTALLAQFDAATGSQPTTQLAEQGIARIDNSYTLGYSSYIYCVCTQRKAMRDAAINLRALPEQRDLIDHAATLLGKNRSDFMLEAACDKARAVVLDQVFFSLNADKFQQFTAMLDAPPSHNPGLERLMAVAAPWATVKA